jgi:hypothetical protein
LRGKSRSLSESDWSRNLALTLTPLAGSDLEGQARIGMAHEFPSASTFRAFCSAAQIGQCRHSCLTRNRIFRPDQPCSECQSDYPHLCISQTAPFQTACGHHAYAGAWLLGAESAPAKNCRLTLRFGVPKYSEAWGAGVPRSPLFDDVCRKNTACAPAKHLHQVGTGRERRMAVQGLR